MYDRHIMLTTDFLLLRYGKYFFTKKALRLRTDNNLTLQAELYFCNALIANRLEFDIVSTCCN